MPLRLRRPQLRPLLASAAIAVCVVAIGFAFTLSETGRERLDLPEIVESIDPVRGAVRVPAQTQVFVDLAPGYTGVLVVDGLELETVSVEALQDKQKPGQQIVLPPTTIYEPGNATLTFVPSPDADIQEFSQGEHIVQVIYWKVLEDRGSARSYTWTFNVF
ncbi:MAG: hypothetical protein ACO3AV_00080 [Ilumatobacteraceae bacterium]